MVHKQRVIARIKKKLILDAMIYRVDKGHSMPYIGSYFLCHNDPILQGSEANDKLGYKYSWVFHEHDITDISGNKYSDSVKIYEGNDLKQVELNEDLNTFIAMEDVQLIYLFLLKSGRFEKYDSLSFNKDGLIIIGSSELNKTIEMKIGRFIRTLVDDNKDLKDFDFFDYKDVDNNWLEEITNRFKKFVSNEHISGGYDSDNYFSNNYTLYGSCMTDKLDYLDLYAKNSNIELGVLYFKNKIIARCMVWNTGDKKFHDRIYCNEDWAFICLDKSLKDMGIDLIDIEKQHIVDLEYVPDEFPYLDNMRYLDPKEKQLTNIRNKNRFDMCLGSQSGGYETLSHNVIEKN